MPDEKRLRELLAEATADCYGEEEEFWGLWGMFEDVLDYPLSATLIGETVEIIDLNGNASSPRRGIVAQVRYKGQTYGVSLADLHVTDASSESADWLAAYQYWWSRY